MTKAETILNAVAALSSLVAQIRFDCGDETNPYASVEAYLARGWANDAEAIRDTLTAQLAKEQTP